MHLHSSPGAATRVPACARAHTHADTHTHTHFAQRRKPGNIGATPRTWQQT